ncbi:MAG: TldD/PmbA family protein [Prolixibacteraceae bacterium]|jgi:PmbA protein|nr:TldD/PmbA family protein [Prolixibacteraceae bacterium]
MTKEEKYKLAKWAMHYAIEKGADQARVSISDNKSSDIDVRENKIDTLKEAIQSKLTIHLYVDKKYSAISTNRLNQQELARFIEEGIETTRFLAEDEFRTLPEPELYYKGDGPDLKAIDPDFDSVDAKTKIDMVFNVENEIYKKDDRIISVTAGYSDGVSSRIMVASNGFEGDTASSYYFLNAQVTVNGGAARPESSDYKSSITFGQLEKRGIAETALKRALGKIGQTKIDSGKYTMIVENRSVGRILGPVLSALNGSSIQQKNSFMIDKMDQQFGSPRLTLVDDPLIIGGRGSKLFDAEGMAMKKRPVFEKGVLKTYFIDTYYGKKLGMAPNSGETSNLVFEPGDKDLDALVKLLKKGILVTGFNGGNCNSSTGDFSYGIEGFLIENGVMVKPVSEMNITGNMHNLWGNLVESGSDVRLDSSWRMPSLVFADVDFSGM